MAQNPLNNNGLDVFQVPKNVYSAIKNAAAKTGVNFTYLMEKAATESSFDPNAKAKTSSATGLFQFIDSTWLSMVKDHGDKYGLSKYADKIDENGKVADAKTKKEILNLRKDPEICSLMAAEFACSNNQYLQQHVGGKIGSTELYMAHFLGAAGASDFLNAMKQSPNMTAADLFPAEARANRNVFYDQKTGAPKSLRQIYASFDTKFNGAPAFDNTSMLAANNNNFSGAYTGQQSAQAPAIQNDDPFARLATLMNTTRSTGNMLRLNDAMNVSSNTGGNWQMFPPSLYNKLSLSPAQMMMLSDFNA